MGYRSLALSRLGAALAALSLACPAMAPAAGPKIAPVPPESTAHPDRWPQVAWPETLTPAQEARVQALLAAMDIPCKAGQLLQADIPVVTPEDVAAYHLGSVLNGGGSGPKGDDLAPPRDWLALADAYYAASMKGREGCPPIPIMWGIDAVHGQNNIIGATLFPHNVGLGATRDPALVERIGAATAAEIRVTGQDWTFAPTVAVPQDYRWGRAYEGYGSDPALVAAMARAMITGLQGPPSATPILERGRVAATAKHFLGDGGTANGRDQGNTQVDESTLRWAFGTPYAAAIEAGVSSIMTSYSSWNGTKMHGNRSLLTDVLKDRMGFAGMIVTDWSGHGQIPGCTPVDCAQALNAGNDMYMIPQNWKQLHANLVAQAQDGSIPMARLDDAVARVLRMKMRMGLFEAGRPSARLYGGDWATLGSPAHRALAREAVRESLVLLKNDGVLPLKPSARILVAGDAAVSVARQSGGWTLSWQGTGVDNAQFPGATTIWQGISDAVRAAGGTATLSETGQVEGAKPDAAIVVFGEMPYAEILGDIPSLQLPAGLRQPLDAMKRLRAAGIPVVAVMLSGRPLFVNAEMNAANAFVAAWLPGSEGEGIADLLFAADGLDFRGHLPMPWPLDPKPGAPALFGYGYGLTLAQGPQPWTPLGEDPGVPLLGPEGLFMDKGKTISGWNLVNVGPSARVAAREANDPARPGARHYAIGAGPGLAGVELRPDNPVDLRREAPAQVMVVLTMKFDAAPAAPWNATVKCGEGCEKTMPLPALAGAPVGRWFTFGVPLNCFPLSPPELGRVTAPLSLGTAGPARFALVRIELGTAAEVKAACPAG